VSFAQQAILLAFLYSFVELSKGVTAIGFPRGGTVWDEGRVTQDLDIRQ
jgi:hypothetical protein